MKIMEKNAFLYESAIYLVKKPELFQGRKWLTKTGWARSNVAHRCRPAAARGAPSILPKAGCAIAHPAHPPLTLLCFKKLTRLLY